MEQPRDSDLRAALDLLLELGDAPDPDAFAERAVTGLGRLIPSDLTAYNGLDPARRRTYALLDPPGELSEEMAEALSRHMEDNPLVTHHVRTHDGRARRISDFISRRELHRRPLYNEMFRYLGIEYQMVAALPTRPPLLLGLVLNRTKRDFTERELALVDVLRPHLVRAYENAHSRATLGALEEALEAEGTALLVLSRAGTVEHGTRRAWGLLTAYFDQHGRDHYLPQELADWITGDASRPFTLEANGRRLRVRLLRADPPMLLLEEDLLRIDESALASLGLSRREREVLALVAEGMTNAEIAALIWVSPRTVKKHLEGVYEKLGVHTRTAAAAIALRTSRGVLS